MLKVSATDVIAIYSTELARLPVLKLGGHSSLSNSWDTYRWACPCTGYAHVHRDASKTCRWKSAAAGASGDRVLASYHYILSSSSNWHPMERMLLFLCRFLIPIF